MQPEIPGVPLACPHCGGVSYHREGCREVEDFLATRPEYTREHVEYIASVKYRDATPYCWECHDWHYPDEEHTGP
jgi:hypothetical protein